MENYFVNVCIKENREQNEKQKEKRSSLHFIVHIKIKYLVCNIIFIFYIAMHRA